MKAFVYPEQALVRVGRRKLKRPVKWQSDRSEGFVSDNQGRDHVTRAELALDDERSLPGLARLHPSPISAPTCRRWARSSRRARPTCSPASTRPPAIAINVKGVCTNTVPVCAYRGAGRPEAAYLIERLVDAAARELEHDAGRDPPRQFHSALGACPTLADQARLRLRRVREGDGPLHGRRPTGRRFRRRGARESEKRGKLRGIGMATYTERCGGGFPETASIEFKDDRVELVMGNQEYGTGLITSYKQLVSDRLGIDADRIDVDDGRHRPYARAGSPAARARSPSAASALHEASLKIIDKGTPDRRPSAGSVGAPTSSSTTARSASPAPTGASTSSPSRTAARDPAKLPPGMEPGLDTTQVQTPPAQTFPNGCHIVEVEIDPDSGRGRASMRYTVVDDFGAVINPILLEGQVHGGIVQGIGQALLEHTVYDDEQRPASLGLVHGLRDAARRTTCRSSRSRPATCRARPIRSASRAQAKPARSARRRR